MKPITADNAEGRALLALRAGPMTSAEVSARVGQSVPGWLLKAGYVTQDDSYYRITEAGRAACPYRNPLAAPGGVQPAIHKPEISMSDARESLRAAILAKVKAAGAAGITRKELVESIDASAQSIDNVIFALNRDGHIFKPKLGLLVAIEFKPKPSLAPELAAFAAPHACGEKYAEPETQSDSSLTDAPQAPAEKQEAPAEFGIGDLESLASPPEVFETIGIKPVADRRQPAVLLIEHEENFEIGIFSDSTMTLVWEYGINAATIEFCPDAVKKLRRFLGLFSPEAA